MRATGAGDRWDDVALIAVSIFAVATIYLSTIDAKDEGPSIYERIESRPSYADDDPFYFVQRNYWDSGVDVAVPFTSLSDPQVRSLFVINSLVRDTYASRDVKCELQLGGDRTTGTLYFFMDTETWRGTNYRQLHCELSFDHLDDEIAHEITTLFGADPPDLERKTHKVIGQDDEGNRFWTDWIYYSEGNASDPAFVIYPGLSYGYFYHITDESELEGVEYMGPQLFSVVIIADLMRADWVQGEHLASSFHDEDIPLILDAMEFEWPPIDSPRNPINSFGRDARYLHYWDLDPVTMDGEEERFIREVVMNHDISQYYGLPPRGTEYEPYIDANDTSAWCENNLPGRDLRSSIERVSRYVVEGLNESILEGVSRLGQTYVDELSVAIEIASDYDPRLEKLVVGPVFTGSYGSDHKRAPPCLCLLCKGIDGAFEISLIDPVRAEAGDGEDFDHDLFVEGLDAMDRLHFFCGPSYFIPLPLISDLIRTEKDLLNRSLDRIDRLAEYYLLENDEKYVTTGTELYYYLKDLVERSFLVDSGDEMMFLYEEDGPGTDTHERLSIISFYPVE